MNRYVIWYADGTSEESNAHTLLSMTDGELQRRGIVSVDRWSTALEDYVEARRVP